MLIAIDGRTSLRLLDEPDAEALFALVDGNRAYLRQWLPWLDQNTCLAHTRAFIVSAHRQLADSNGFSCGLWHNGTLTGVVGLHAIDWTNRRTSLGYWIAERFQGRGLISTACTVLLDHLFGELRLHRVEISCAVENKKSRAVPERLGFTSEGVSRQREWLYDHFVDHVIYGLLAREWRGAAAFRSPEEALAAGSRRESRPDGR